MSVEGQGDSSIQSERPNEIVKSKIKLNSCLKNLKFKISNF